MTTSSNAKKRVFIIHGFDAHPRKHWFVWLKQHIQNLGASAEILPMPTPQKPILSEWIECIKNNVGTPNSDTFFVAHSLGTISTLQYIMSLKRDFCDPNPNATHKPKLGGILLVSGFCEALPSLPELNSFTNEKLDFAHIITSVKNRIIIAAQDDEIVPYELSQNLAQSIEATFVREPKGGHFMQSDGFDTFELLFALLKMQLES